MCVLLVMVCVVCEVCVVGEGCVLLATCVCWRCVLLREGICL